MKIEPEIVSEISINNYEFACVYNTEVYDYVNSADEMISRTPNFSDFSLILRLV